MHLLLNEASLNVTIFRYCCMGFFLAWNPQYLFPDRDAAVTATFQVLVNTYFLSFRLPLLWLCLLIVLRTLAHLILVIFHHFLVFNFPFFNFEQ